MNPAYKQVQQQSDRLFHKLESCIDDPKHPAGVQMVATARMIREDVESNRQPRSVEVRVEQLKHLLHTHANESLGALSPHDAQQLHEAYEELRRELRHLPNY